jgi:hypothetical protein
MNEEYTAKILEYRQEDLNRIRCIRDRHVLAQHIIQEKGSNTAEYNSDQAKEYADLDVAVGISDQLPRICLGTTFLMGLVPPEAEAGDVIVRFWNCNAAIVMRRIAAQSRSFVLVGRADVAQTISNPPNASLWAPNPPLRSEKSRTLAGAVSVRLSLRTLQKITAYISTHLENT